MTKGFIREPKTNTHWKKNRSRWIKKGAEGLEGDEGTAGLEGNCRTVGQMPEDEETAERVLEGNKEATG